MVTYFTAYLSLESVIKKAAILSTCSFTRLAKCSVSKVIMTVNWHVFQPVPHSDLQISSANHISIRKYLLVVVLINFCNDFFFLNIAILIYSGYCSVVGSIVK